jgi:hypothetical protein
MIALEEWVRDPRFVWALWLGWVVAWIVFTTWFALHGRRGLHR